MPNLAYMAGLQTMQTYQKAIEASYILSFRILKLLEENDLNELNYILDSVIGLCSDHVEQNTSDAKDKSAGQDETGAVCPDAVVHETE